MPSVDRLVARKARLTHRLGRSERRAFARGREPRDRKWLRAALYRVDQQLDTAGWFDA